MTMELVRGKTLSELQPKNGFALSKFLEISIPLADAVAAAHQEGITHRDLKPDNMMQSDDGRIKVLDFGLAKPKAGLASAASDSDLPTENMTAEGRILGTLSYMSPEQAEGKPVDERSDIFSLGIVFYEMLTGQRPFRGDTHASTLSVIIKDTPQSSIGDQTFDTEGSGQAFATLSRERSGSRRLAATCKDSLYTRKLSRREDFGGAHEPIRAKRAG